LLYQILKSKKIWLVSLFLFFSTCSTRYIEKEKSQNLVVLLHGILDQPYTMLKLENGLSDQGYSVLSINYPTIKTDIDSITNLLYGHINPLENKYKKIHFVTHSMGGLVIRAYLNKFPCKRYGKLVMIAPPNKGAILADRFDEFILYKWILGKTGQKLGKDKDDYWNMFPVPEIPFGIISGGMKNKKGVNPLIPGDDDGIVGVEETQIKGAQDSIIIKGLHSSILWKDRTLNQVKQFIEQGEFNHKN